MQKSSWKYCDSHFLINLAGEPTKTLYGGTSLVTTEPAPIIDPSPITILGKSVAFVPIVAKFPIVTWPAIAALPIMCTPSPISVS